MKVREIRIKEEVSGTRNKGMKAKETRVRETTARETKIKETASVTKNKDRVSVSKTSKVDNRIPI